METVGIVGAGFMGSGIAESTIVAGLRAVVYEPEAAPLERSRQRVAASLDRAVNRGKLEPDAATDALQRSTFTTGLVDLLGCDLVIEAVTEDERIKIEVFHRLDATIPPDAILASNTSSIPIANVAAATSRPDRVLGLHFFAPVAAMNLVEVVPTLATSADVVSVAEDFVRLIGKQPIRCKDRAGFLVNVLLIPYLVSAVRLYEDGVAAREDIDDAIKLGCGHPMGPLALCDFIGLDIIHGICASLYEEHKRDEYAAPPLLRRMVSSGQSREEDRPWLLRVPRRTCRFGSATVTTVAPSPAPLYGLTGDHLAFRDVIQQMGPCSAMSGRHTSSGRPRQTAVGLGGTLILVDGAADDFLNKVLLVIAVALGTIKCRPRRWSSANATFERQNDTDPAIAEKTLKIALSGTTSKPLVSRNSTHCMLADEQAALRRVATLVAEGATPAEVFAAVAREIGVVLRLPLVAMFRYEPDGTATGVGSLGEHPFQPGTSWPLDGPSLTAVVRRTARPARVEDYAEIPGTIAEAATRAGFTSGVGAPIVVDGELWGVVGACSDERQALPPDAESRLSQFTALVATAISNTQAREDLHRLATEQAALRRLATLVAQGAPSRVVFDAVCEETGGAFGASSISLAQFTPDGFSLTMAGWSARDVHVPAGTRLSLDGDDVSSLVRESAAPVRLEGGAEAGAPVVVEGRVWGALIAASDGPEALPAGTEHRLASLAEMIATAVSSAAARSELVDSRVRIVEAADEQRRRVVRDLHDGAQSRLIHTVIALERAKAHDGLAPEVRPLVEEGLTHARSAIEELRELAHGIHPATLTNHGLAAAIRVLADQTPLAVQIEIADERYPTPVESALYFVAAEALTNVVKYARASAARISVTRTPGGLRLVIEDDGVGGTKRAPDGGLAGLGDRLAALHGVLAIDSPPGHGTRIRAEVPLPASA